MQAVPSSASSISTNIDIRKRSKTCTPRVRSYTKRDFRRRSFRDVKLNVRQPKLAATIGTAGELRGVSRCSRFSTILRLIVFPHRFVSREVLWHLDGIGPSCLADLQMPLARRSTVQNSSRLELDSSIVRLA